MCLLALTAHAKTPTAADILARASQEMRDAGAIKATFTAAFDGNKTSGEIIVAGNRFNLSTPEIVTWFDGKTQWSYSHAAQEVNVSEPTKAELEQINPFAIMDGLKQNYKARRLASPQDKLKLELTPEKKSDYAKITLTLNATTYMPEEIVITSTDRSITAITVSHLSKIKTPAQSAFKFDRKLYPMAAIIDLR